MNSIEKYQLVSEAVNMREVQLTVRAMKGKEVNMGGGKYKLKQKLDKPSMMAAQMQVAKFNKNAALKKSPLKAKTKSVEGYPALAIEKDGEAVSVHLILSPASKLKGSQQQIALYKI